MRYDTTFGSDYAKPQLVPAVPLTMPMAQQMQQQQPQQTTSMATQQQQQQQQSCKCEFCEYLQANRISLTGDHSFQCEFCGEGFSNQTSFNRHRCGGMDIQIYRCETCRQEYGSSRAVSNIGNCEPRDKCDICNRTIVQSLPEEQAAYGPSSMVAGSSSLTPQTTPASMSDGTIDGTISMLVTSPEVSNESVSDLSANVRSIVNSPIEQHDLSSIDPFGSDSECLGQFFATEATSTSPCTASTTGSIQCTPMPTSANIGSLLPTTALHQPESAKTYFVLGNVDQLQQFHAAAAAAAATSAVQQQPSNNLPTVTNNSFHPLHLPPPGPGPHQQQQQQLPLSLQNVAPVTAGSHLPSEHEVTSLQQYDQYDDEDYSSMSEDEAIVPIEPYAKSPNQDHAKTELPIQETIVDTSTGGSSTVIPLQQFGSGGLPRDDAALGRALMTHGVAQHMHVQPQSQPQPQHHHPSNLAQTKTHLDDDEEGKCDSSSPSLGIFVGGSTGMANGEDKGTQKTQSSLANGSNLERPYKCHICERSYRNQKNLKSHLKVHEGIRAYQCEICGKNFSGSSYLVIHRRRHTGERPFKCVTCGKAFVDSRALAVHARLHSGERLKCEKCEKTFSSVSALTVHNRLHTGIHPYKCELCGKTFPQYNNLKHHMKKHEQPNAAENRSPVSTPPTCGPAMSNGVSTTSGSGLASGRLGPTLPADANPNGAAHMVASSTTGPPFEYKCHICSKLAESRLSTLPQHGAADLGQCPPFGDDSTANGNDRYKCTVCSKVFRSSEYLVRHRRTHSGERPYQCEICGKNFSTMSYLVIHRRRHTSERPYKCTSCEKAFVDSRALQEHARLHTGDRVRCEICQKTYSSVSNLIVHRRIHSGIHPFECDSCGKSFAQKNALKYHLKKHNKQDQTEPMG
uniref:Protein hunchback n=1 Tax=Anopheles stephensi TaxID=30069 RepID=A0A182YGW0_ANOST